MNIQEGPVTGFLHSWFLHAGAPGHVSWPQVIVSGDSDCGHHDINCYCKARLAVTTGDSSEVPRDGNSEVFKVSGGSHPRRVGQGQTGGQEVMSPLIMSLGWCLLRQRLLSKAHYNILTGSHFFSISLFWKHLF